MSQSDEIEVMKQHSKMYVGNLLIKMFYPNVITFLLKKLGSEDASKRIFQIGLEVGRKMLKVRPLKTTDIKKMISRYYKIMWGTTKHLKIKKIKEKDRIIFQIIDTKCGLCDPETAIEGVNIPCVSIDGYLQACLEYVAESVSLPSYRVKTVKSVATGDSFCEHLIEMER